MVSSSEATGRLGDFGATAVIKRNGHCHSGVTRGVRNRFTDRLLDVFRCSGGGIVELASNPLNSDVEFIEFSDSTKKLFMKTQNVADFASRTDPILCGESENG